MFSSASSGVNDDFLFIIFPYSSLSKASVIKLVSIQLLNRSELKLALIIWLLLNLNGGKIAHDRWGSLARKRTNPAVHNHQEGHSCAQMGARFHQKLHHRPQIRRRFLRRSLSGHPQLTQTFQSPQNYRQTGQGDVQLSRRTRTAEKVRPSQHPPHLRVLRECRQVVYSNRILPRQLAVRWDHKRRSIERKDCRVDGLRNCQSFKLHTSA